MKKYLLIMFAVLFTLFGCSGESPEETADVVEESNETTNVIEEVNENEIVDESLTLEEITEIITDYGLSSTDTLENVTFENGEIKATIMLGENQFSIPADEMAVTTYSQISDELLNYGGWEVLTVEFVEVGTISMNISQKETNEFDMPYFPALEIKNHLK